LNPPAKLVMWERYLLYFLMGGTVVTLVTYLGSHGKGWLAAFVAMFPAVTVLTFTSIYLEGGGTPLIEYIKGLLAVLPGWLCYLFVVFYLAERIGLPSIGLGILAYVAVTIALRVVLL
jgi:uncharacterized membrane protein (GlpM family)